MLYVYWTVKVYLIAWWKSFWLKLTLCLFDCLYVVLLLLRWSSIYWWEQMREEIVVNRGEMNPLHSLPGLNFLCWLGFLLGQWPMYCLAFRLFFFENCVVSPLCFILASWCALVTVQSCDCTPGLLLNILFYVTFPFNLVY